MLQRRKDVHLKLALALDISDSMNGTPDGASASTLHIVLDCMEQICRQGVRQSSKRSPESSVRTLHTELIN